MQVPYRYYHKLPYIANSNDIISYHYLTSNYTYNPETVGQDDPNVDAELEERVRGVASEA